MRVRLISLMMLIAVPAFAHDHWINQGGYHNKQGAWCCGTNDCHIEQAIHLSRPLSGWVLKNGGSFIPEREVLPSEDGQIWVCRIPQPEPNSTSVLGDSKDVRCVFVPFESY